MVAATVWWWTAFEIENCPAEFVCRAPRDGPRPGHNGIRQAGVDVEPGIWTKEFCDEDVGAGCEEID
jgi:hypothetical protein